MDERLRSGPHVFVEDLDAPVLDDGDAHHLGRVLRLRSGEALTASDGAGSWRPLRWTGSGVEVDGAVVATPAPPWEATVAAPPVKGDRPEWMVAKLTELGVDEIVLLEAERSVVRWSADRARRHLERLERVAREAAMQSRRVRLPRLVGPVRVAELVAAGGGGLAVADPDAPLLGGGAASGAGDAAVRGVAVGPEGGWTAAELEGFGVRVGLPGGILRTETAAVVAATLLVAERARSGAQ